nr:MAG TPA: hypothetical protein [Caudoviricetes sp.]
MVTQPSIAQGIEFNIQYFICILEPGNNRGSRIQTYWIYQNYKVMRQRL